jgi:hypothetical protein
VRHLDALAAGETSGQEAQRGSSGCGGGGSVPTAIVRTHARRSSVILIPDLKAVGECLACQDCRVTVWAVETATCATCTAATGLVAGAVTVDAWREGNEGETSVEHRPILLRSPRGARGVLASVPGPRWGLRWRHTIWHPTSRGTLQSAECQKRFQAALFESIFLQKFQQKWSKVFIPKLYTTLPSKTLLKALGFFSQPVVHKLHAKLAVFWAPMNSAWER